MARGGGEGGQLLLDQIPDGAVAVGADNGGDILGAAPVGEGEGALVIGDDPAVVVGDAIEGVGPSGSSVHTSLQAASRSEAMSPEYL